MNLILWDHNTDTTVSLAPVTSAFPVESCGVKAIRVHFPDTHTELFVNHSIHAVIG